MRWRWSSCASPWPSATRAACTWCWRACPPRPPTSWRTTPPIPSNTDKLALVRLCLPSIWHAMPVAPCFDVFQTTFGKLCYFLLSSVITSTPSQTVSLLDGCIELHSYGRNVLLVTCVVLQVIHHSSLCRHTQRQALPGKSPRSPTPER